LKIAKAVGRLVRTPRPDTDVEIKPVASLETYDFELYLSISLSVFNETATGDKQIGFRDAVMKSARFYQDLMTMCKSDSLMQEFLNWYIDVIRRGNF
jgi:hypothetical protein